MNSTTMEALVLKTDNLGRMRTPPQRREALLAKFEKSGISGMKFAGAIGVKYQTFAWWVRERAKALGSRFGQSSQDATKLRWVEAVLEEKALTAGVEVKALRVQLPGGAHLEVADRVQALLAAELLRALLSKKARVSC